MSETYTQDKFAADLKAISEMIIGQDIDEVRAEAEKAGWLIRQDRIDGKKMCGTADFKRNRLHVIVENGKVVKYTGCG